MKKVLTAILILITLNTFSQTKPDWLKKKDLPGHLYRASELYLYSDLTLILGTATAIYVNHVFDKYDYHSDKNKVRIKNLSFVLLGSAVVGLRFAGHYQLQKAAIRSGSHPISVNLSENGIGLAYKF